MSLYESENFFVHISFQFEETAKKPAAQDTGGVAIGPTSASTSLPATTSALPVSQLGAVPADLTAEAATPDLASVSKPPMVSASLICSGATVASTQQQQPAVRQFYKVSKMIKKCESGSSLKNMRCDLNFRKQNTFTGTILLKSSLCFCNFFKN